MLSIVSLSPSAEKATSSRWGCLPIMAHLNWLTSEAWGDTTLANGSCRRTLRSIRHPKYSHLASGVPVRPNISWRVLWAPLVVVHTRTIPRCIRASSIHGLPQLFADISFLRWWIPIILPSVHGVYLLLEHGCKQIFKVMEWPVIESCHCYERLINTRVKEPLPGWLC